VVLSFVALTLAASQQAAGPLRFVGIIAAIALVYYFAFLRPRRKAHFIMNLAYEEPEAGDAFGDADSWGD
jgi:ABC-type Fe3+-siderophore transport system permease subunit